VTGRITPDASTRLEIQVHDLTSGSKLVRVIPVLGAGDAFSVARHVARTLLPDLIRAGGAAVDEGLLSENVPALAAYLQGERAYRRGDYHSADSLFGFAVQRDSSFAWAALRGAQAANWLTDRQRASEFVAVALKRINSLPPRYAAFARGLSAYGLGQADSAVAYYRQSLAFDHRWAEAHMSLGEVYHHYLPGSGIPNAGYLLETAAAEFDSALTYDPGFSAPLFHATQHAVWKGNRPRADSLFLRFSRLASGSADERQQLDLMRRCLDEPSASAAWKAAARRDMTTAMQAVTWVVVGGLRHPGCATDALKALLLTKPATGRGGTSPPWSWCLWRPRWATWSRYAAYCRS
jgi:tetratricopeptide (TPR) repeat protein